MSTFSRSVFGVLAVGMIAGFGALMLLPQSAPQATARIPDPPGRACSPQAGSGTDATCPKATVARRAEAHSIAALRRNLAAEAASEAPKPDVQAAAEVLPTPTPEPATAVAPVVARTAAAPAKRSAENARAAQRRKAEGLQAMHRFGDNLSDVGASAYAANGAGHGTVGGQRTRQGNNHGSRNQGGFAMGNGFFPMFR
jgi:hypothetical protein